MSKIQNLKFKIQQVKFEIENPNEFYDSFYNSLYKYHGYHATKQPYSISHFEFIKSHTKFVIIDITTGGHILPTILNLAILTLDL